jgi:hypothetical protein
LRLTFDCGYTLFTIVELYFIAILVSHGHECAPCPFIFGIHPDCYWQCEIEVHQGYKDYQYWSSAGMVATSDRNCPPVRCALVLTATE